MFTSNKKTNNNSHLSDDVQSGKRVRLTLIVVFIASLLTLTHSGQYLIAAPPFPTALYTSFPETFESGTKGAYSIGSVTLGTGTWILDDALIGTSTSDRKEGGKSVRMRNSGRLTMGFDITTGVSQVSVLHGIFGSDTSSSWGLWYSMDGGSTWVQAATDITTSSTELQQTTFTISLYGSIRFEIRKSGGGRLNIDNVTLIDNSGVCCCGCGAADSLPELDDNLTMGNPSAATDTATDSNNLLIVRHQYTLSYNNSKGMANWVSWHLNSSWKGDADRCDCFTQDELLPTGYYKAATSHYTGSGFDRGHLCPSDDRDANDTDNAATFKMTNISPQAPQMNQITWAALETYCRSLVTAGKELYIIAGGYGSGGSGSLGGTTTSISSGNITVPARFWKVIVVLPLGSSDLDRVNDSTRVIAVDMPNQQTVTDHNWDYYRTTTDAIETATGYDFLSNVPDSIQTIIEAAADTTTIY